MFCPSCGVSISDDSMYCLGCGVRVGKNARLNPIWVGAFGVVVVAAMVLGGGYFWFNRQSESPRHEVATTSQRGELLKDIPAQPVPQPTRTAENANDGRTLPPEKALPQSNVNDWGDPLAKLMNGSYGNGSGGVTAPTVLSKVEPEYSGDVRTAGGGDVLLSVLVDSDGTPREITVLKSLTPELDEKAVEAVRKWKFRPGMKDGIAVNVRAQIEVKFRLKDEP